MCGRNVAPRQEFLQAFNPNKCVPATKQTPDKLHSLKPRRRLLRLYDCAVSLIQQELECEIKLNVQTAGGNTDLALKAREHARGAASLIQKILDRSTFGHLINEW